MSVEEVTQKTEQIDLSGTKTTADDQKQTVKHPLNTEWTLWYTKPQIDPSEDWSSLLRPIAKISSVEEFWGFYSCIPRASTLPPKSDYHLFRNDIRPEWEDPANSKGGKWSVFISDSKKPVLDELWLKLMLSAIGELLEEDESTAQEINGVVFNCKKKACKFGIWTKSLDNEEILTKIGLKFKNLVDTKLSTPVNEEQQQQQQQNSHPRRQEEIVFQFMRHDARRDEPAKITL
ncbi:hypothetical protein ACO0QE_000342 [Hanseniaspora vineae]